MKFNTVNMAATTSYQDEFDVYFARAKLDEEMAREKQGEQQGDQSGQRRGQSHFYL